LIYLDSSVALAAVFTEDRQPPATMWDQEFVSSRLLQYEIWTQVNARRLQHLHGDAASALLAKVTLLELSPPVLDRALASFPIAVRTLDALHLASIEYLRRRGDSIELASYDTRLLAAAKALRIPIFQL